jgi:hypothetical protein
VVDIGAMRLPHILDLMPILERARCLLSIDTAPIHLAYATMTPTIVISRNEEWSKSEPRKHWLGQFTFAEAMHAGWRKRIAELLTGDMELGRCCRPMAAMLANR